MNDLKTQLDVAEEETPREAETLLWTIRKRLSRLFSPVMWEENSGPKEIVATEAVADVIPEKLPVKLDMSSDAVADFESSFAALIEELGSISWEEHAGDISSIHNAVCEFVDDFGEKHLGKALGASAVYLVSLTYSSDHAGNTIFICPSANGETNEEQQIWVRTLDLEFQITHPAKLKEGIINFINKNK